MSHSPCEWVMSHDASNTFVQGGQDPQDALSCRFFFAKKPLIIGLFCGKWPVKIRHPMGLRHSVDAYLQDALSLQIFFRKRATNSRALLRQTTCKFKASYGSSPPCRWVPSWLCIWLWAKKPLIIGLFCWKCLQRWADFVYDHSHNRHRNGP